MKTFIARDLMPVKRLCFQNEIPRADEISILNVISIDNVLKIPWFGTSYDTSYSMLHDLITFVLQKHSIQTFAEH